MARGDLAERLEAAWRSIDQPTVTAVTQALFNQDRGRNWSRVKQIVKELGLNGDLSTDRSAVWIEIRPCNAFSRSIGRARRPSNQTRRKETNGC